MFDIIPVTSPKEVDCGATCMKMLLKYYGEDANLVDLIIECNTRISGCTGKDLIRVGRNHGLDMKAFRMDPDELIRQDRPAIVWWKFKHWCVFCGRDDKGQVVIVNPDRGLYRMSGGLFTSFYSGVSLFNGEPEDLPEPEEESSVFETVGKILMGVEE